MFWTVIEFSVFSVYLRTNFIALGHNYAGKWDSLTQVIHQNPITQLLSLDLIVFQPQNISISF